MTTIAGAGAAGLSLALMLDGPVTIYEREKAPGGLCRSTTIEGFTFDVGPHILGGIPDAVAWVRASTGLEFVDGTTRNAGWLAGRCVRHPFEDPAAAHAYMAKMWKADPDLLSLPALAAQAGRRPGGVRQWCYPARGGYQAITDAWAARLDIEYEVACGFGAVDVWTGPVPGPYNTLTTVTIGCHGDPPDLTALYLPERWTPFHRVSFPAAFSPANAPEGCYSIQGEISGPPPDGDLVAALRDVIDECDLASRLDAPIFAHVACHLHAYPVPTDERLWRGHGRTGGHRYLNLDGVVAASMRLAAHLNGR